LGTTLAVLAVSHHTSVQLAEVGLLVTLSAGVWLVASEIPALKMRKARTIVAGTALALAGLLLITATHDGSFGQSQLPRHRPDTASPAGERLGNAPRFWNATRS